MILSVVIAANEILGLGDQLLLLFIGPRLHLEALRLLPPIGREVARVAIDRAAKQLDRSIRHAVEKIAVVADDDHGLLAVGQKSLEPLRRFDVEMIRRFVEQHHVGLGQQ